MDIADKLIGRQRECEELKWAVDSRRSEFSGLPRLQM